ncbi:hypothetical protein Bca4012_037930 [Brassica carinata]
MSTLELPPKVFAAGEEPSGNRVNSYHKVKITQSILEALTEEEVDFFKNSSFSRVISFDDNPPFSGAFCYFVLSMRLKTNKKYEIWVVFAGTPIRISLRGFAIVTGLNCGRLPNCRGRKRKNPLNEKLYWNELFGSLKSVSVGMIVDMLKNKKVKDRDNRIKFACLAIVNSVLLPSSHTPKGNPEHVELIRDLDELMAYPWGRVSFQALMSSLLNKDELALAQDSFALRDYVEAIQLVMIVAVPELKEEVTPSAPVVVQESDCEEEENEVENEAEASDQSASEKPADNAKYVRGRSVLDSPHEQWDLEGDIVCPDELIDPLVDTLLELVNSCFRFKKKMFKGGLTVSDLTRMRSRKRKAKAVKDKNDKEDCSESTEGDTPEQDTSNVIANMVVTQLKEEISGIVERVAVGVDLQVKNTIMGLNIDQRINRLETFINPLPGLENRIAGIVADKIEAMQEVNEPSFSLGVGVSQEPPITAADTANPLSYVLPASRPADPIAPRKSTRSRATPAGLEDFKCDPTVIGGLTFMRDLEQHYLGFLSRTIKIGSDHSVSMFDFLDIALKSTQMAPKDMDSLMAYISSQTPPNENTVVVADTNLPATLMSHHSRFLKMSVKDRLKFKFTGDALSCITPGFKGRLYFPFNIDQQHWIGACVDFKAGLLHVIDCNTAVMSDSLMRKELSPVANMLPYISYGGSKGESSVIVKAFNVSRCKGIPQVASASDAAVMTVLLIDAHKEGGVDA